MQTPSLNFAQGNKLQMISFARISRKRLELEVMINIIRKLNQANAGISQFLNSRLCKIPIVCEYKKIRLRYIQCVIIISLGRSGQKQFVRVDCVLQSIST